MMFSITITTTLIFLVVTATTPVVEGFALLTTTNKATRSNARTTTTTTRWRNIVQLHAGRTRSSIESTTTAIEQEELLERARERAYDSIITNTSNDIKTKKRNEQEIRSLIDAMTEFENECIISYDDSSSSSSYLKNEPVPVICNSANELNDIIIGLRQKLPSNPDKTTFSSGISTNNAPTAILESSNMIMTTTAVLLTMMTLLVGFSIATIGILLIFGSPITTTAAADSVIAATAAANTADSMMAATTTAATATGITPFTLEEWMWASKGGYLHTMMMHYIRNGGL